MSQLSSSNALAQSLQTALIDSIPSPRRLSEVIVALFPGKTLTTTIALPSARLPRLYTLTLSDGTQLLLSMAPTPSVRLLRHEQILLSAEAALLSYLESAVTDRREEGYKSNRSEAQNPPEPDTGIGMGTWDLLPRVLKHSSNTCELAYPYSIFSTTPAVEASVALSSIAMSLSVATRRSVDTQIGRLASELSTFVSPTAALGPVPFVCSYSSMVAGISAAPGGRPARSSHMDTGSSSWAVALMSMLESILRDGEDMSVLLPYGLIRAHFGRLYWRLEEVKTPRLLILDVGDSRNVLLVRRPGAEDVKIVGLRDWSHGIFGDPMLADCFEEASEATWEGWHAGMSAEELTEGPGEGDAARLLLYKVYNVVVQVITEYYRPRPGSGPRELQARRMCRHALDALEENNDGISDIEERKRPRGRSSDIENTEPAKRLKLEGDPQ